MAALVTALVAEWVTPLVPPELAERVRDGAAREILTIVASSMLMVATFSLGIMVQAFAAAAQVATPRATAVLIDDPVSQNVLSTFLGAFVFGMVALFAHSISYYGKGGEAVLMLASAALVAVVTATFFGWLDHLTNLVRLGETVAKIERRAADALTARAAAPHLGGVVPRDPAPEWLVLPEETGYVRHVDVPRLQKIAEAAGGRIRVVRTPGRLADPTAPLARLDWGADPETEAAVRAAFTLGPERSFDQDPRFCLAVLTEIASRALSPGVNDPGTAIGVLAALQRLLAAWSIASREAAPTPERGSVEVPALEAEELFEDAFGPLHRDAAPILEVGLRLQKTLAALAVLDPQRYAKAAAASSALALEHAEQALALAADRDRIRAAAAAVRRPAGDREPSASPP